MNTRETVKKQIEERINEALEEIVEEGSVQAELEVPREKERGDFACTVAMQLPRLLHKPPREIAQTIVDTIDLSGLPVTDIEIAGPGFINFKLDKNWLYPVVTEILEQKGDYGKNSDNEGKTYNMEFVSANPTGPMHIGNARGGAIGDVLAEVASWNGYDVTREFYINDAGNQIQKLKDSLEARYEELTGEDVDFPEDGYKGEDLIERVKELMESKDLSSLSKDEREEVLSDYTVKKNIQSMQDDLGDYGIDYDVWFSEQSMYDDGSIEETLKLLEDSGKTYEKDGAIWFKSTDYGLDKDDVLVRNNGIPTYYLGDITYHLDKLKKRKFDRAINVWGADHYGHVARLKAGIEAAGEDPDKLEIILMQLVKLIEDGKEVRISKRTGKTIHLTDLLEQIGVDASRFYFNMRSPESHLILDLDLAIEESNDNPVFYLQYAHARISSILKNLGEPTGDYDLDLLVEDEERHLIEVLSRFPEEIRITEKTLDPSRLTHYSSELASAFHSFYNACRVDTEDEALKNSRLALITATRQVIKNLSTLLGINAPESM